MADKKISQLNSAGALSGSEVFPIVQSSVTKKLALNDIGLNYISINAPIDFQNLINSDGLLPNRIYQINQAHNGLCIVYIQAVDVNKINPNGLAIYLNNVMSYEITVSCVYNYNDDNLDYVFIPNVLTEITTSVTNKNAGQALLERVTWEQLFYGYISNCSFYDCMFDTSNGDSINTSTSMSNSSFTACTFYANSNGVTFNSCVLSSCVLNVDESFFGNCEFNNSTFYNRNAQVLSSVGYAATFNLENGAYISLSNFNYCTVVLNGSQLNSVTMQTSSTINLSGGSNFTNIFIGTGKDIGAFGQSYTNKKIEGRFSDFDKYAQSIGGIIDISDPNYRHIGIIYPLYGNTNNVDQIITYNNDLDIELIYANDAMDINNTANISIPNGIQLDNASNKALKVGFTKHPSTGSKLLYKYHVDNR